MEASAEGERREMVIGISSRITRLALATRLVRLGSAAARWKISVPITPASSVTGSPSDTDTE